MKRAIFPVLGLSVLAVANLPAKPFEEAQLTRTVNIVTLLRPQQAAEPAKVGTVVKGTTAVQTGNASRAELEFPDETITRLGANALFRFAEGSRQMELERGTMLFSSPKGAGGGEVQAGAVTAAVSGTNYLAAYVPGSLFKLIVLEGKVKVGLRDHPGQYRVLRAGEMLEFNPSIDKLPKPVSVDLKTLISTSRLLESGGFEPLPAMPVIVKAATKQQKRIGVPKGPKLTVVQGQQQQVAQITRQTEGAVLPQPKGPAINPPKVQPQPGPFIPPPKKNRPPRPRPSPSPFTGGGGAGGPIGSGGNNGG